MQIPTNLQKLPVTGDVPRVSVNSFGYGGTNAHVILEQAPVTSHNAREEPRVNIEGESDVSSDRQVEYMRNKLPCLMVISARSKTSLLAGIESLRKWALVKGTEYSIRDVACTLCLRRAHFEWRLSFVASDVAELSNILQQENVEGRVQKVSGSGRVVFLFTGQGAQWCAMGRELMVAHPRFRDSLRKSSQILEELGAPWKLLEELSKDESTSRLGESEIALPATIALQIALVEILSDIGIRPDVVIGHSSGEIAAAFAAKILSHRTALKIAYTRSFVSRNSREMISIRGAMLAVGLGELEVLKYIDGLTQGTVCIACINSPTAVTVSGDEGAILELQERLDLALVFNRRLNVDAAYHSHHMRLVSCQYLCALGDFEVQTPPEPLQYISTVTGSSKISGFGSEYWVENLVSKVRYSDAIQEYCRLQDNGVSTECEQDFIEIGPHPQLATFTRQIFKASSSSFRYDYHHTLIRGTNAVTSIFNTFGALYTRGHPIHFAAINAINPGINNSEVLHDLPPYEWDHSKTYWYESRLSKEYRHRQSPSHDLLGVRIPSSTILEPRWRHIINVDKLPWLEQHKINGLTIFPGTAYLCMAIEAAHQILRECRPPKDMLMVVLSDVSFKKALVISEATEKSEMQLSFTPRRRLSRSRSRFSYEFRISALSNTAAWTEHCTGLIKVEESGCDDLEDGDVEALCQNGRNTDILGLLQASGHQKIDSPTLYRDFQAHGNYFGPDFAAVTDLHLDTGGQATAHVRIPDIAACMPNNYLQPHVIHPTTLDALLQSSLRLYTEKNGPEPVMPEHISEIVLFPSIERRAEKFLRSVTNISSITARNIETKVSIFNSDCTSNPKPVLMVSGLKIRGFTNTQAASSNIRKICHRLEWGVDAAFLRPSHFRSDWDRKCELEVQKRLDVLNQAASIYLQNCLDYITWKGYKGCQIRFLELLACSQPAPRCNPKAKEDSEQTVDNQNLLLEASRQGRQGEILCRIGDKAIDILMGKIDPYSLVTREEINDKLFRNGPSSPCYAHMAQLMKHLCFKHPNLTILELGTGTGSTTCALLEVIGDIKSARLDRRYFTDVPEDLFDPSKALFKNWGDKIHYRKLDIEQDPVAQGFEPQSCELVVASNVLYGTSSIDQVLTNIYKVLKPGGLLALNEVTRPQAFMNFILGFFSGPWKGTYSTLELHTS